MTRKALALSLLRDAGPRGVTTAEFLQSGVGSRYSARVRELRQQGHDITSERVREGSWRYVLDAGGQDVNRGDLGSPRAGKAASRNHLGLNDKRSCAPADSARLFDPPSRYDDLVKRSA